MLIVLETPDEFTDYEKLGKDLASRMNGKTTIYMPTSLKDYTEKVRKYRPKKTTHLVLLKSHYGWLEKSTEASWRLAELLLQSRGGSVYGEAPARVSETYEHGYEDLDRVVLTASWYYQRALIFNGLSKGYLGRTSSDPHTLILGFMPTYPNVNILTEFLVGSLKEEWWQGVAFMPMSYVGPVENVAEWLSETNILAMGEDAHNTLEELGIHHGRVPALRDVYSRTLTDRQKSSFGAVIRNASTQEEDQSQWKI